MIMMCLIVSLNGCTDLFVGLWVCMPAAYMLVLIKHTHARARIYIHMHLRAHRGKP